MKELMRYELTRSYRFYIGILASMIAGIIVTSIALCNTDYNIVVWIALGSVLIFGVFALQIERRTRIMIKDLMGDYSEHMITIPVTVTNIVSMHYIYGVFEGLFITLIAVIYVGITSNLTLLDGVKGFVYALILVFMVFSLNMVISTFVHRILKKTLLIILIRIISWSLIITILLLPIRFIPLYYISNSIPNYETFFIAGLAVMALIGYLINCKIFTDNNKQYYKIGGILILVIIFACISAQLISYCYRNVDNTNIPFENDNEVIGTWNTIDFVRDINYFDSNNESNDSLPFKGLVINENGMTNCYNWKWTRGYIINSAMLTVSTYNIKNINGSTYMFMQWKSGDYIYFHMKPSYYVMKKAEE